MVEGRQTSGWMDVQTSGWSVGRQVGGWMRRWTDGQRGGCAEGQVGEGVGLAVHLCGR